MSRKLTTTAGPAIGHNSLDKAERKSLVERIEAVEQGRAELAEDVRGIYQEARGAGFDVAAIRTIIKMRKQDAGARQEREALVAEYMSALGDLADLPLGRAAMARDGIVPPV